MRDGLYRYAGLPELFQQKDFAHNQLFAALGCPWDALKNLPDYLAGLFKALASGSDPGNAGVWTQGHVVMEPGAFLEGPIFLGEGTIVQAGAYIRGPAWIGRGCEIRQGAYLRGMILAGDGCVLGHASEFKHCILFDGVQAPHFNYVGDSILGNHAHIGAGVILSNVRLDKKPIRVQLIGDGYQGERIDTGLEKLGAVLGDACEVGCNTVLNPGTILGTASRVAPVSSIRRTWKAGSVLPILS